MPIRPTIATVDLDAIRHNLGVIRQLAPGSPICAVVKANAYGHGLCEVALALADAGVDWLAVALVEEGARLRAAGIHIPVLLLGTGYTGSTRGIVQYNLTPAIYRVDQLESLAQVASSRLVRFHLKIDTGMSRLGLQPEELGAFLDSLNNHPNLRLDGVMTHFANADIGDAELTQTQLDRFNDCTAFIASRGIEPPWVHTSNSAAVLSFPNTRQGLLRTGLSIYGIDPRLERAVAGLRPAMQWTTRVMHLKNIAANTPVSYGGRWTAPRPSRIATLPVGYADGYMRTMGNRAYVLVRGQRAPIVGSVCMDLCLADVTDIPNVAIDDEVVILGKQGDDEVSVYRLAEWAGTIPYEIVCAVGNRVPREHYGSVTRA
ncbi:MAG: alanine racemase [Deltaproteobacteria bacterium RIFOXYB12_FULL_58_9]|nr:MAG: alanine racemase [Deltaproteobacteria bacterium RIFOXYB12_FULL_58_9]